MEIFDRLNNDNFPVSCIHDYQVIVIIVLPRSGRGTILLSTDLLSR